MHHLFAANSLIWRGLEKMKFILPLMCDHLTFKTNMRSFCRSFIVSLFHLCGPLQADVHYIIAVSLGTPVAKYLNIWDHMW